MTEKLKSKGSTDSCRTALFAGSFDPFTTGHASIVERALPLFDRIVIGVGCSPDKHASAVASARVRAIAAIYADEPRVQVAAYSVLTCEFARSCGAQWLLRGVRSVADFEAERNLADINRRISGLETILLPALPELGFVSSSMVRELSRYGADVDDFLPHSQLNESK